jgi:hypothetical protein
MKIGFKAPEHVFLWNLHCFPSVATLTWMWLMLPTWVGQAMVLLTTNVASEPRKWIKANEEEKIQARGSAGL